MKRHGFSRRCVQCTLNCSPHRQSCKRRCCATRGCALFTHNGYGHCFLRVRRRKPPTFFVANVRHRTVTCRRTDLVQCRDARHQPLRSATRSVAASTASTTLSDATRLLGGTCNLTQHRWLIILSHGRSGSTTLLQMLRQLPGVALSGEHAGVMTTFRRLRDQLQVIAEHKTREEKNGNPDYSWHGRSPITRPQLLCLAQSWALRALDDEGVPPLLRGWKEIRYTDPADLNFIAEAFPRAQFVINYRLRSRDAHAIESKKLIGYTDKRQRLAASSLRAWAAARHNSSVFDMPLESFSKDSFTRLAAWLGMAECKAERLLHFNRVAWYAAAKGRHVWHCAHKTKLGA